MIRILGIVFIAIVSAAMLGAGGRHQRSNRQFLRGIELATGGVRHDGVLATDGLVTCFETSVEVRVMQTYELSRRKDTLFATPHGTSLVPNTLHRVSE